MSLTPIYGHDAILDRLAGALASSRFPQAAALVGVPGVGKQRLALWVAQGLLCSKGQGAPCGECSSCIQVLALQHPDLHWFVPIPRPKSGDPQKQMSEAEQALGEIMAERRANPTYSRPDGMASHSLASVRLLQRKVSLTPFSASRKVFILGDAERLVVQEASQEAANALLKVLEEPPDDTTIILTTSESQALLPTIRSRMGVLRVNRVSDEEVRRYLETEVSPAITEPALTRRTFLAEGSIGKAVWLEDRDQGEADAAAQRLLEAVSAGAEGWTPIALAQTPWAARGGFTDALDALVIQLREKLIEATERSGRTAPLLRALERVEKVREEAQGNANPQLALADLAAELEEVL